MVVVGGGNSAVDAALDLYRAGARVTLVHFGPAIDRNVKPWVMPDITNRIAEGSIAARFESRVTAIEPEEVVLATPEGEERIPAAQVYLMLGYQPNNGLLQQLDVPIDGGTGIPAHDPATMADDGAGRLHRRRARVGLRREQDVHRERAASWRPHRPASAHRRAGSARARRSRRSPYAAMRPAD